MTLRRFTLINSMVAELGLSHYRYQEEAPFSDKEKVLANLLTMFAPRPFLLNRFIPQGTMAVLRAMNNDYMDIVFRYVFESCL